MPAPARGADRIVLIESSADKAAEAVATVFKGIVCEAVGQREACYIALSGGTTPHALYGQLARDEEVLELPWPSVEVFFGDERDVPHDHTDSNYRMAQRALLDHVPIRPGGIHPMPADAPDLAAAAGDYEQLVRRVVPAGPGGLPRFDMVLLGMGADGHTASLFPGSDGLKETRRLVVGHFVPVLGRQRMTFTLPLINAARVVVLLVTGADKADAVARLLGEDASAKAGIPAAGIAPAAGKLYVVLDADAARRVDRAKR
jgi:6-phosphogluconolactonase